MNEPNASVLDTNAKPPAWRLWLACAALVPYSFNIGYYLHPKKFAFYVAPLDVLTIPLVLILLLQLVRGRMRDWLPPLGNLYWAGVAVVSILWSDPRIYGEWARSALGQTVLVVLCAVWVFEHFIPDAAGLRRLALALGAVTGACFLYALYQYVQPEGLPLPSHETGRFFGGGVTNVRLAGWFEFRGQFAAQVAMMVPACAAFAVLEKDSAVQVVSGAIALLGLCVCMYGGGVLAACTGAMAVAAILMTVRSGSRPVTAAIVASALLVALFVVLPRLTRDNPSALWRTVSLFTHSTESSGPKPTARLRRYQAAANFLMADSHWLNGAGAGKFQSTINSYYDSRAYPKPGANTDDEAAFDTNAHEPMTYGLVETTAVELGALGLLGLALVFATWLAAALAAYVRLAPEDHAARALALASAGACVGAAIFSVFGSPFVRGCAGTFAFFMGAALYLNARATETPKESA